MNQALIITGNMVNNATIQLDEKIPFDYVKVRVIIEKISPQKKKSYKDVMNEIRNRQKQRNFQPSSKSIIDKYISVERNSWD